MNRLLILALITVSLSGCASLLSSSDQRVFIDSAAGTAHFIIHNKNGVEMARGQTPANVILPTGAGYFKNASYLVYFTKPHYQNQTYSLVAYGNPWYYGNFLNIIGFFIDPATGAMWQLPDSLVAVLPSSK